MPRSKRAPALFEVIRKQGEPAASGKISIPRWWKGLTQSVSGRQETQQDAPTQPEASSPPTVSTPVETPRPVATASAPVKRPEPKTPQARPAEERVGYGERIRAISAMAGNWAGSVRPKLQIAGSRIDLSLNPVSFVVVGGAVLLAVFCSYQLGKHTGAPESKATVAPVVPAADPGLDAVAGARKSPPNPSVMNVPTKETRSSAKVAPPVPPVPERKTVEASPPPAIAPPAVETPTIPPVARVPGLNHVVVERFHTGLPAVKSVEQAREHAEHAQKWLAERCGIRTILQPINGGYRLVTEQMFKYSGQEKEACDQLKDKILGYGKQYAKEGNLYLFGCQIEKIK